jgi:hypothetical protein
VSLGQLRTGGPFQPPQTASSSWTWSRRLHSRVIARQSPVIGPTKDHCHSLTTRPPRLVRRQHERSRHSP